MSSGRLEFSRSIPSAVWASHFEGACGLDHVDTSLELWARLPKSAFGKS